MRKFYTILLMALPFIAADAGVLDLQSKMELRTRARVLSSELSVPRGVRAKTFSADQALARRESTLAFVRIADGYTADDLAEAGIDVVSVRGQIAIADIPYDRAEELAAAECVQLMQFQRTVNAHMDLARAAAGTDVIHEGGDGLPKAYTGKGVIAGIVDQGMDPNHINFLDADGENRIKYLSVMRYNAMGTGLAPVYYGEDIRDAAPLSEFSTDDQSAYHGTHTLGIMAGGYKGDVEVSEGLSATGSSKIKKTANPYYGVATGSDLAVSCGLLTDVCIASGIEQMYYYASEYKNMPVVYNLSLGSNVGPHDPKSIMSSFLDIIGDMAIICVSAGNEGDAKASLSKTLANDGETIKTFVNPHVYRYTPDGTTAETQNTWRYGQIGVYGDDDTEFSLRVVVYRRSRGYRVAYEMPATAKDGNMTYYWTSANSNAAATDVIAPSNTPFAQYFDGYVAVGCDLDPATNRYYCTIGMDLLDKVENYKDASGNDRDAELLIGIEVVGKAGHRYDFYSDALTVSFDNYGVDGFTDGSRNGTISDMAVGHNIISVGSYNTRQEWYTLDGARPSYPGDGFRPGYVSDFSSFGTLADGRNLPHVCAPGAAIISSISTPYLEYVTDQLAAQNGVKLTEEMRREYYEYLNSARATDANGKAHYWKQEVGTSMSTPFVAGNIALWLEADPTLTVQDVKDIIARTAVRDEYVEAGDPVQWGAGKFNALAGLKEVIRNSGIGSVGADGRNDRLMVTMAGDNVFNVFVGEATSVDATLTSMSGACMLRASSAGDELTLDASSLPAGIYVLSANGHSQKVAVK